MSRFIYCTQCGHKAQTIRKAIKGYGRIIDMIEPHTCSEEPIPLDLSPTEVPVPVPSEEKSKFIRSLDDLTPSSFKHFDLGDNRPKDQVKSSAPGNIASQISSLINTTPAHDLPSGDE